MKDVGHIDNISKEEIITPRFKILNYFQVVSEDAELIYQITPQHGIIFKGKYFTLLEFLDLIKDIEV